MHITRGQWLALASAACFGTLTISGRYAYADGVEVSALMAWRFGASAVAIWAFLLISRRNLRLPLPVIARLFGVGALLLAPEVTSFFNGLASPGMTAGLTETIFFIYPVWAVLLFGRRSKAQHRVAAVIAAVGVGLTAGGLEGASLSGVGWLLLASVLYATYVVLSGKWVDGVDPWVGSAWMLTGAGVVLVAVGWVTGSRGPTSTGGWLAVASAIIIGTLIAYALLYAALHVTRADTVAVLTTAEPVVAILLGRWLWNETMNFQQVVGVVLILAAVAYLLRSDAKRLPPPEFH